MADDNPADNRLFIGGCIAKTAPPLIPTSGDTTDSLSLELATVCMGVSTPNMNINNK